MWYNTSVPKGTERKVKHMDMTYHCQVERADRVQHIIKDIGLGQVVKKSYKNNCYVCITDTGITLIKDAYTDTVITMYVTTFRELVAMYKGVRKIPPYLRKRVDKNQSKYTEAGKTIWR